MPRLAGALIALLLHAAPAGAATYQQFETPDGQFNFDAKAVNDDGLVVGRYLGTAHTWKNGIFAALPGGITGTSEQSDANDVNDAGAISGHIVAGTHADWRRNDEAVVWDPGAGAPRVLERLDPEFGGRALAINDAGVAAGMSRAVRENGFLYEDPVRWQGAEPQELAQKSRPATAIDNAGTVLLGDRRLWKDGLVTELGCLTPGFGHPLGEGGVVVGSSDGAPARWQNGECTPLPLPEGTTSGAATAMAADGTIVGYVFENGGNFTGVVWPPEGGVTRLATLLDPAAGVSVGAPVDINDRGQILTSAHIGGRAQKILITLDAPEVEVTLEAIRTDGQPASSIVADQDLWAKLTVANTGSAALQDLTFAGGTPFVIDARGTGRVARTGAVELPPGLVLEPGESETGWYALTTVREGVAAAHTKVTARTADGEEVSDAHSLLFRIANRQRLTQAIAEWLVLQTVDRYVFQSFRDYLGTLERRARTLHAKLRRALDPKERRAWFGSRAGKLEISPWNRAMGLLRGEPPELVAARTPKVRFKGFTAERLNREYDDTLKAEVGDGVRKWVKGYADLGRGVDKAMRDGWSEGIMNAKYLMGAASMEERLQVEAFWGTFATGAETDAGNVYRTARAEAARWQENAGYLQQALDEMSHNAGLRGFANGLSFWQRVYKKEKALRASVVSLADSDPLRFQREMAKLDARYLNAGLPIVLDTLLGAGATKVVAAGRRVKVADEAASVFEAGSAGGWLDDAGRPVKGANRDILYSTSDDVASGVPMQTATELTEAEGLLAAAPGATLVQASDVGNVYRLPNLGGVPEATLDAKAGILRSIEADYAAAFPGRPAPKLVEVLKTSSPLRKPGSVAKLELTAGKTGKEAMIDAGMPAGALGEAVYWESRTHPSKLKGFHDLPSTRQDKAIKEWALANERMKKWKSPPPGSKEAKLKSLIGTRGRVPLDDVPNKAGLQRFVIGEFEEVVVREGDATARLIRVKHYEIEVVDTTRGNLVVNRKTVIDNLGKAAAQTADADAVAVGKVVGTGPDGAPVVAPLDRAEREFVMSRYIDRNVKARRSGAVPDLAEHGVTLVMEDASAKAAGFLLPSYGAPFLPEAIGRAYLGRIAPFVKPAELTNEAMLEKMLELVRAEGGFGQHAVAVTSDSRYLGAIPFESW